MKDYNIKACYFKLAAKNPDAISVNPNTPPWFVGGVAEELICNKDLYERYYKKLDITLDDFIEEYTKQLVKLNPYEILEKYEGKILLGWYSPDQFDTRQIIIEWIKQTTGYVIEDLTKETYQGIYSAV